MADSPFTGLTAKLEVGNNAIAYISGVDLTIEKDIIEIIAFGSTFKEKVPAISDWSATADGTAAFSANGSQEALMKAFENSTAVSVGIYLDNNTHFKGNAYVENLQISAAADDKSSLSCSLAGSGAIKLTTV